MEGLDAVPRDVAGPLSAYHRGALWECSSFPSLVMELFPQNALAWPYCPNSLIHPITCAAVSSRPRASSSDACSSPIGVPQS